MSASWFERFISFEGFSELLPLVSMSLVAALIVGVIAGVVGPIVQSRDLAFAVHGSAELSFAGAAAALLIGIPVTLGSILGSIIAALIFAGLGLKARDRNSAIGVVMAFGLGLGVLFLALSDGRSSNKFGLLVGQIVGVAQDDVVTLAVVAAIVLLAMAFLWRPLMFASIDPEVASARGVPVRWLSLAFMLILGLTVAMTVQIIGALLVLSLLITPTAAAMRVTAAPWLVMVLSMVFAVVSAVGGVLLSLSPGLPISPYVTSLSFAIYLVCRVIGALRQKRGWTKRVAA